MVTAAPDLVAAAFIGYTAGLVPIVLVNVLSGYSLLDAYALMGYLLYQYRFRGHPVIVEVDPPRSARGEAAIPA